MTLSKWMCQADVDDGAKPGATSSEAAELREAKPHRLLEQENEVRRRAAAYWSQSKPAGK